MALFRQLRRVQDEADDDVVIPINRAGLVPWHWGGLRGEMVTLALVSCVVLLAFFHAWKLAIVVPLVILAFAKILHRWHAYWIELLIRLVFQPSGWQDS